MNFYELRSEEETFGWAPIRRCLVCNYKALHKNYGVLSCNGCSGFFRRSIKSARSYVCLRGKNCSITYGNHKRTCQYCRFKKCCDAGMSIDFVIARHNDLETTLPLANSENSFFTRLTDSFNSAFVQRFRSLSRHPKRPQNGSLSWHRQQFKAEFEIVMHYLKYTGIRDLLNNESEAVLLTTNFLSQWIFLSCCWNTLRHRGFCHNQYFFVDEIQIKVTLEDEQAYLEREPTPDLRNVPFLAHTLLDLHISTLEKIKRFHDCDFDLSDLAFICQIITLKTAISLFPCKKELRVQLSNVFLSIRSYYDDTHRNTSIRMGNIILLISEVAKWESELREWLIFLQINGQKDSFEGVLSN